ncbi:hypothetical protein NQZ68_020888 [Dissostichus eleginoides]|nr:hypothetical protein NQZ68_020888 [Dissostichus eleginoides]
MKPCTSPDQCRKPHCMESPHPQSLLHPRVHRLCVELSALLLATILMSTIFLVLLVLRTMQPVNLHALCPTPSL